MTTFGVNSEFGRLTAVLLHAPGPEIAHHHDPPSIQHLRSIDPKIMAREYDSLIATFSRLRIEVILIDPTPLGEDRDYLYNLMYCRDLLFMNPNGAIIGSMANRTRRDEVLYARRTLEAAGIPVLHEVSGAGRFEGADALWINEQLVAVGVGNRTNSEGFAQIRTVLERQGVATLPLPSHQTTTQHLLGSLQIVDRDLALVRAGIIDREVIQVLEGHGYAVVPVPENIEVTSRQALNIVTIAPRTIIMTAGCPETKGAFQKAGLNIAAEIEISQLINGAGGLACATGIIAREKVNSFDDTSSKMV